jgi:hypothetical protein
MSIQVLYNTFIGTYGSSQFVHLSNATGTPMNAAISDNLIYNTTVPYYIEDTAVGSAGGFNNWMPVNATPGVLSNSVQSASPGFLNTSIEDYHLAAGSACIGAANATVYGLPGREYYYNELTNLMWRPRAAARDIGAFESTSTSSPVGGYDQTPQPPLNFTPTIRSTNVLLSWPLFAQNFQLKESVLLQPAAWNIVPGVFSTNASNVNVTVPITTAPEFFRLQEF